MPVDTVLVMNVDMSTSAKSMRTVPILIIARELSICLFSQADFIGRTTVAAFTIRRRVEIARVQVFDEDI